MFTTICKNHYQYQLILNCIIKLINTQFYCVDKNELFLSRLKTLLYT